MSSIAAPVEYLEIKYEEEEFTWPEAKDVYANMLLPFADSELYCRGVKNVRTLARGADVKSVYDICVSTKDINYEFIPGETIGIIPCNSETEVDALLERLDLTSNANKTYTLSILKETTKKRAALPIHIPSTGSLRHTLIRNIDIRSIPKKLFLRALANYTTVETESKKLIEMCAPSGSNEYNRFINEEGKTLLGILKTFPSCKPPIARLLENLPALRPRPYSISCSPLIQGEIHFAVSVLCKNKGVCSSWLERNLSMSCGQQSDELARSIGGMTIECNGTFEIPFYFRKGNAFRIPEDLLKPIIMIGPGTGIAPFIGFIQHRYLMKHKILQARREALMQSDEYSEDEDSQDLNVQLNHSQSKHSKIKNSNTHELNKEILGISWLFFGCRYSTRDFLYKKQLEGYLETGTLSKLFKSFSRESEPKSYVQDNIIKYGKELMDLMLLKEAAIFVCGDAKNMRKDVRNAVERCLINYEGKDQGEAEKIVGEWQKSNRYIEDIWL